MMQRGVILLALITATPVFAQTAPAHEPIELPRLDIVPDCDGPADEIVVCARRLPDRYRVPPTLREPPLDPRNYSWAARARDERERARYDDQASGPGGWLNYTRQRDCQWRAERQELLGRQVDCSRRVTPLPGEAQ